MKNTNLLKISLIISIIGILLLLVLANTQTPKLIKIKDINKQLLDKKIQVQGKIQSIKTFKEENFQIITIQDSTGKINVILDNPINITKNQTLTIIGKVAEYKDTLQIQADKIEI